MSRMLEGLTGFKNNFSFEIDEQLDEEEELKEFCEFMEEEVEIIEEINQDESSIDKMIDYSKFPTISNSCNSNSSKGSGTLLCSSFDKQKVKKKRKHRVTPLKNVKTNIIEKPSLVSPTMSTPPSSPFQTQSLTFENIPQNIIGEYISLDVTPSNYPSNLTHVSSCMLERTNRVFMFGSCVMNRKVSTHLVSFSLNNSKAETNTNLKQQHLTKFPKEKLPQFSVDSKLLMIGDSNLINFLFIYSNHTFYNAQVDRDGNLLTPFRECTLSNKNESIEGFSMVSKIETGEILQFGGRNSKTQELSNELYVLSSIDKKQLLYFNSEKILPKSSKIPCPRQFHAMCYDSQKLYIFGGIDKNGILLNDLHCFDLEEKKWREIKTNVKLAPLRNCKLSMAGNEIQLIGGNLIDGSANTSIISIHPGNGNVKINGTKKGLPNNLDDSDNMIVFGSNSVIELGKVEKKKEIDSFIHSMLEEDSHHDVVLEMSSGNSISANRFYLANRSKYFEKLFETYQESYMLEGLQDETIRFYVNFLYTGYPNMSILPKPVDPKFIEILQVDQNHSLRKFITDGTIYITDIYQFTQDIELDISKLYNISLNSKNQSKSTMKNSSLICIQLMKDGHKTDHYLVEKAFARRIQFFGSMLDSGMIESETRTITLDVSSECCEKLIEYMYTGEISTISEASLFELYILSTQYLHSQELIQFCEQNLHLVIRSMTPQVAVHILDYFKDKCHEMEGLISRCRYYICSNFNESREEVSNLDIDTRCELGRLYMDHLKRQAKKQ